MKPLWIKKTAAITALCALVFLRMVDLAVFDSDHDYVSRPHIQVHAVETAHGHDYDASSEHEIIAHGAFHTLVSVFIEITISDMVHAAEFLPEFDLSAGKFVRNQALRPPVPPPLG